MRELAHAGKGGISSIQILDSDVKTTNAPYHLCKGAFSQDYHIQNANTTLFLDLEVILSQGQNHMFRSLSSRNR